MPTKSIVETDDWQHEWVVVGCVRVAFVMAASWNAFTVARYVLRYLVRFREACLLNQPWKMSVGTIWGCSGNCLPGGFALGYHALTFVLGVSPWWSVAGLAGGKYITTLAWWLLF